MNINSSERTLTVMSYPFSKCTLSSWFEKTREQKVSQNISENAAAVTKMNENIE